MTRANLVLTVLLRSLHWALLLLMYANASAQWHSVKLTDGFYAPVEGGASTSQAAMRGVIVHACETTRNGTIVDRIASTNPRNASGKVYYEITEVIVGSQAIIGQRFVLNAVYDQKRDLRNALHSVELHPKPIAKGYFLLAKRDESWQSVSMRLSGIRFPCWLGHTSDVYYKKCAANATELKSLHQEKKVPQSRLRTLMEAGSQEISMLAAWRLCNKDIAGNLGALQQYCGLEEGYPLTQCIIDSALMSSGNKGVWQDSPQRQMMIERWFRLQGVAFFDVMDRYIVPRVKQASSCWMSDVQVSKNVAHGLAFHEPASREAVFLKRVFAEHLSLKAVESGVK